MPAYNIYGEQKSRAYRIDGTESARGYSIYGDLVFESGEAPITPSVDYTRYRYTVKWASKGISSTQGFAIHNDMVFWVKKSGDMPVPASCYVWNLSDGTQALENPYITIYAGHGNSLSFDYPLLYAAAAYLPSKAYVNRMDENYNVVLEKTLMLDSDGSRNCDVCVDEDDPRYIWSLAHTAGSSDLEAPFLISKWDVTRLTANGDGTYTPRLVQSVETPQPANSFYFQGCCFHDGMLWYANGYSGAQSNAYIYAVDPSTGNVIYTIDCETTAEPEGVQFYPDDEAPGGYAMYVGFQGMALRRYTFEEL